PAKLSGVGWWKTETSPDPYRRANHFVLSEVKVKPSYEKFPPSVFRKTMVVSPHPASARGDVSRSSRTLEVGCGGRPVCSVRKRAPTKACWRTAKACGPGPPMLGSS